MKTIRILFLGASKRASLMEQFLDASKRLDIHTEIFSCELKDDFYPISWCAKVLEGPSFRNGAFAKWLCQAVELYNLNIIIPNMDSATTGLSKVENNRLLPARVWAVVSDYELCLAMEDKILANNFFRKNDIQVPENTVGKFPKIIKHRLGFGSRSNYIVENKEELNFILRKKKKDDYIIQDFISGQETTVDLYFSRKSALVGFVIRDRLEVSDGEVMVCRTRDATEEEVGLIRKVSNIKGWQGCITLQYIRSELGKIYIIEINPRFGGGVTCSIEAGLDIPSIMFCEYLGVDYNKPNKIRHLVMTRARKDYFYEYE